MSIGVKFLSIGVEFFECFVYLGVLNCIIGVFSWSLVFFTIYSRGGAFEVWLSMV